MKTASTTVSPANNFIGRKVVGAIDDLVDRGGTALVIVHSNTTETLYQSANRGKVSLFYSPIPVCQMAVSERNVFTFKAVGSGSYISGYISDYISDDQDTANFYKRFIRLEDLTQRVRRALRFNPREYYYVQPEKALVLLEMVRGRLNPDGIMVYLGSENKVTSEKEILAKTNFRR